MRKLKIRDIYLAISKRKLVTQEIRHGFMISEFVKEDLIEDMQKGRCDAIDMLLLT